MTSNYYPKLAGQTPQVVRLSPHIYPPVRKKVHLTRNMLSTKRMDN